MKAVFLKQFGGVENFELREVESPPLEKNTVKVRIKAAAFNPIDYQMRQGATESKLLRSQILGREFAGVVTEIDEAITDLAVGDEVYGYAGSLGSNGTYADEIVVPRTIIARKPANLSFAQAAALPLVGLTATQALERCAVRPEDRVFVAGGAGGVGSMIVRLLRPRGLENVFSTAGNEESRLILRSFGMDEERILDYREADLTERLLRAAGGRFDVCLDTVGGKMSEISAEVCRINGVYADITFLATAAARELLFNKATTVVNVSNYAYTLDESGALLGYYGERLRALAGKFESGEMAETPIEIVGPLSVETVAEAHILLEQNRTRGRKLVMEFN